MDDRADAQASQRTGRGRACLPLLGVLLCLGACQDPRPAPVPEPDLAPRAYRTPTAEMQARIQALLTEMETTEGATRLALGGRLLQFGEASIQPLLGTLDHADVGMRATGVYLLGRHKDPRTYDAIAGLLDDADEGVRYEAATALVRGGDPRGMAMLIRALGHTDPRARKRAIDELARATGDTLGYRYDAHPAEREPAVARWRTWLDRRAARARE